MTPPTARSAPDDLADLPPEVSQPLATLRAALAAQTGGDRLALRLTGHEVRTHQLTAEKTVRYQYQARSQRHKGKASAALVPTPAAGKAQAETLAAALNADIAGRLRRAAERQPPALNAFPDDADLLPDARQRQWGVDHACAACASVGKIDCVHCKALGMLTCATCAGTAQHTCGDCKGAGTSGCTVCQGSTRCACTACEGKGRKRCQGCDGAAMAWKPCHSCVGGRTYVTVTVRDRNSTASATERTQVDCPECRGAGRLYLACERCFSTGSQLCAGCDGSKTQACTSCFKGNLPCVGCACTGKIACERCEATGQVGCPRCARARQVDCGDCSGHGWHHDLAETILARKRDRMVCRTDVLKPSAGLLAYLAEADSAALAQTFAWRPAGTQVAGDAITRNWAATTTEATLTLDLAGHSFTESFYGPSAKTIPDTGLLGRLVEVATRSDDDAIAAALKRGRGLDATLRAALGKPAILARLAQDISMMRDPYTIAINRIAQRGARGWNLAWCLGICALAALYTQRPSSFMGDWALAAAAGGFLLYGWAAWWPKRARISVLKIIDGHGRDPAHVKRIDDGIRLSGGYANTYRLLIFSACAFIVFLPAEGIYKRHVEAKAALAAEQAAIHAEAVRIKESNARMMRDYKAHERAHGKRQHRVNPGH